MEPESTKETTVTSTNDNSRPEAAFFTNIRSWGITRGEHGVVGGVLEGVGARIGLDRAPARIIGVVLLFVTFGLFLTFYAAAWALLPDKSGRIIVQDLGRGTPNVGALIVIAILAVIGLKAFPGGWSTRGDWGSVSAGILWTMIPLALVAGAIVLVIVLATRNNKPSPPTGATAVPPARAAAAARPADASTGTPADDTPAAAAPDAARYAVPPAPPGAPRPPETQPAPVPRRPRVPGPGAPIYLLTLASAVLAGAGIWLLQRDGRLLVSPASAWFAVAVVIVGGGIILAGAAGRRTGFLGFLAWTLILGWVLALTAVRPVLDAIDGGVTVTIDGVEHTIGNGKGWFDSTRDGITCGSYDAAAGDAGDVTTYDVSPGQTSVEVSAENSVVVIPADASVRVVSDADVDGSLSIESRNVTCQLDGARGDLYSLLRAGDTITVHIATPDAHIAIEEN